jgi:oligopeptide transport system permease protein
LTDPNLAAADAAAESPAIPTPASGSAAGPTAEKPRGLWGDAWRDLRRRPVFWVSASYIAAILVIAAFPGLFSSVDPTIAGSSDLHRSLERPSADAWFGYDLQGADIYARTIYGAQASIIVGIASVTLSTLLGGIIGIFAGYYGGWFDSLLSRVGDIFLGLPFLLGAIVMLTSFAGSQSGAGKWTIIFLVVATIVVFSWPSYARIIRASVIAGKGADYVLAARALGAGTSRLIFRHVLPNSLAPIMVVATLNLGAYIAAEAALSFLGIGLRSPVVSWGAMISDAVRVMRAAPHALVFPSIFLTLTILAFVLIGDALREALDPKLR